VLGVSGPHLGVDDGDVRPLPTVSVVIATRDRPALLERCLAALDEQVPAPAAVVVVDNSQGDRATREVAEARGARYLVEPRRGVSQARNVGARVTRSDVVAYLDDDAVPESGWLSALLVEFRDPRVAAVTGRIVGIADFDGRPRALRDQGRERVIFGGPEKLTFDRSTADWFERASFGGVGQGANLAIRRSVFASWPGFDERLGAGRPIVGAEEHHAFFSLIDRGYQVVYTPCASVLHPYPATVAGRRDLQRIQLATTSAHLALLLAEHSRYRRHAMMYALQALAGRRRPWRPEPHDGQLGTWRTAWAGVTGLGLYLRTRFATPRKHDIS
jgi:cellulose synthase/poly-beta-1,6-N-acetylglucosamine synthase-like glycosyltransferase